jgi:hypothetical protein
MARSVHGFLSETGQFHAKKPSKLGKCTPQHRIELKLQFRLVQGHKVIQSLHRSTLSTSASSASFETGYLLLIPEGFWICSNQKTLLQRKFAIVCFTIFVSLLQDYRVTDFGEKILSKSLRLQNGNL